jgi:hypothetical protein
MKTQIKSVLASILAIAIATAAASAQQASTAPPTTPYGAPIGLEAAKKVMAAAAWEIRKFHRLLAAERIAVGLQPQ